VPSLMLSFDFIPILVTLKEAARIEEDAVENSL
jgi:hypothetical protein